MRNLDLILHHIRDDNWDEGPSDEKEAIALAVAVCQGIVDPILHDTLVSELKTALSIIELENIVGGNVVRDRIRQILAEVKAASLTP